MYGTQENFWNFGSIGICWNYYYIFFSFWNFQEERIETAHGVLMVAIQGDQKNPPLITYHDLGLNRNISFIIFYTGTFHSKTDSNVVVVS